mgnify:CR=1 FL=1
MKNIKNKIAIFVVSCFALFALQTSASAVEGLSIGLGYHTGGAMGTGTEKKSDDTANTTEEDGAFAYDTPSVFVEFALNDQFSMGVEYHPDAIDTPENLNKQDNGNGVNANDGGSLSNKVKASFQEHTTVYANINMPYNTYLRLGYVMTDVATKESLATGGAYNDADTDGYQVGLGYNHSVDNGFFVRVEVVATEYNDISATNVNDSEKTVTVSEMYGATASIKIGRSF